MAYGKPLETNHFRPYLIVNLAVVVHRVNAITTKRDMGRAVLFVEIRNGLSCPFVREWGAFRCGFFRRRRQALAGVLELGVLELENLQRELEY